MRFTELLELKDLKEFSISRFDRKPLIFSAPEPDFKNTENIYRTRYRLGAFLAIDFTALLPDLHENTEIAKKHLIHQLFGDVLFLIDNAMFEVSCGTEEDALAALTKAKEHILDISKN